MTTILTQYKEQYQKNKQTQWTFEKYLREIKEDKTILLSAAERMLKAIGEPELIDTSKEARLGRLFGNQTIKRYSTFKDFYGLEMVVQQIVSFFTHAAQNLEEARQILYLLGPVGSAKSSLVEKLKALMETQPIYILADEYGIMSPLGESPLGLLTAEMFEEYDIPDHYKQACLSPWAVKRLAKYEGDLTKFNVIKRFPSQLEQIGITKTEPGDENNQDISSLVGKVDIRKLDEFAQDDPDAYSYSGGLCLTTQGMLDFVEMFKAPLKMLHPLLTATQEHSYKGTEAIAALPYQGLIVCHSNESEWQTFKANKNNEAFLDRVCIVEVPYCLQITEEILIYKKLLAHSTLKHAPIAPNTLELLASFCVLTRLEEYDSIKLSTKLKVYNGENPREKDVSAKTYQEYKEYASANEGFSGMSTRQAYKILAEVFNFDVKEIAADPVHLIYILEKTVIKSRLSENLTMKYLSFIKQHIVTEFSKTIEKDIQTAYLDSYSEYGQALFDRYIVLADHWIQDNDFRDPDTGNQYSREALDRELSKIEMSAEVVNPKDFRHEIVNFALRHQAQHKGLNPSWTDYDKLRRVIESNMFSKVSDLLPIISFTGQGSKEDKKKHDSFIARMKELGYTENQVRRVVEWHMRTMKT